MTIYIVTGFGKSKTTGAMGTTLRAVANKEQVLFAQFLKDGNDLGLNLLKEISLLKNLGFVHTAQGMGGFDLTKAKEQTLEYFDTIKTVITQKKLDLLVLDEINTAQDYNMLGMTDEDFVEWLKTVDKYTDVYCTGRINRGELRSRMYLVADIATDCYCEAHAYNKRCAKCDTEFTQHYMFCPLCGEMLTKGHKMRKGREC